MDSEEADRIKLYEWHAGTTWSFNSRLESIQSPRLRDVIDLWAQPNPQRHTIAVLSWNRSYGPSSQWCTWTIQTGPSSFSQQPSSHSSTGHSHLPAVDLGATTEWGHLIEVSTLLLAPGPRGPMEVFPPHAQWSCGGNTPPKLVFWAFLVKMIDLRKIFLTKVVPIEISFKMIYRTYEWLRCDICKTIFEDYSIFFQIFANSAENVSIFLGYVQSEWDLTKRWFKQKSFTAKFHLKICVQNLAYYGSLRVISKVRTFSESFQICQLLSCKSETK